MNIKEVTKLIAAADKVGQVPLISSKHGIGKSTICETYAHKNGMHFEPLILSLMDTGDLMGIPRTAEMGGQTTTIWAAPDWYSRIVNAAWPMELPVERLSFTADTLQAAVIESASNGYISREELNRMYCKHYHLPVDGLRLLRQDDVVYEDAVRSVLFLDEFNRSPSDILNASLQLILDKRLHSHVLPRVKGKDTFIVSAINPSDGDYTVAEFDPALLDRFVTCDLETDAGAWLEWAAANNVNEIVRDFIMENRAKLHFTPKGGGKGSSSRSWTKAAAYLDSINNTPDETTPYYLKGVIGDSLAAEFLLYVQGYVKSMSVEQIEEIVTKKKSIKSVEKLGAHIGTLIEEIEAIKKIELAESLYDKYKDAKTYEEAKPYLAYLYALPTENLAGYLSSMKQGNMEGYKQLVSIDDEANKKGLFHRIVSKVAN